MQCSTPVNAPKACDGWEILLGGDEQLRLGILEDVAPLLRRQPMVERDRHDANPRGGKVQEEKLGRFFETIATRSPI